MKIDDTTGVMCISRYPHVSYCGRSLDHNEAVFQDAPRACELYKTPSGRHGVVACLMCRNAYAASGQK